MEITVSENVTQIDSPKNLSEQEYIGQGVLVGRENNSEMELEVE